MKIQQLSPEVVKKLRSGIAFLNVAHCIEELVLNSIDADSTCIAVNLNLPLYQIQVIDNGCGIDAEQMKIIGTRYATSKCHSLKDLQNLKSAGFRGEALSSLKEVSSILMIESRAASSTETYCKIFTQGKSLDPKKSLNSRPSKGTSVSVYDFMYNLPVRQKSVSDALDFEECRKLLQSISLMYPNISFTLKNEATGEMCLQLKKCTSLYHSFLQVFGKSKASYLKTIDYQKECYEITGCISTDCHVSKDLQFLYVNKRYILRTKLHKLINSILNKALSSRQKSNIIGNGLSSDSSGQSNQSQCIFALNISCPYDKYDIIFEPRKTMIEFAEWDSVLKVVEGALIDFLKRENLYSNNAETEFDMLNSSQSGEKANTSNFDVQDCKQGLFSHIARRLFEPIHSDQNFPAGKNLTDNLTRDNVDACDVSVCNASGKEFAYENESTSKEFNLMQSERNIKSTDQESICPKNDVFNVCRSNNSEFDAAKATNSEVTENYSASNSKEVEFGIPCRTVFSADNPIMLRVPIKSALSDLQASCSSSNFRKLKEKIHCFARKEKIRPLIKSKLNGKCEKVSVKFGDVSEAPFKNRSLENSQNLCFNSEKYEAKLKEFNHVNYINKSSQCPSVSDYRKDHCKNINDEQEKKKFLVKITKDKSLQCPSVSIEQSSKIISRFEFKEESNMLPLQRLRQSKRLRRKSSKRPVAFSGNLLSLNDSNEISAAKKPKSSNSRLMEKSCVLINSISEEIEEFSEVKANSAEPVIHFHDTFGRPNVMEAFSESSAMFNLSRTNQNKTEGLSCLESSFNLQAFTKAKYLKNCAQNVEIFPQSENNSCSKMNDALFRNDNLDEPENQVNDLQNVFPCRKSNEIISCVKEIDKEVHLFTNLDVDFNLKKNITGSVAENGHAEFEASENISDKTIGINSKVISPNLTDVAYNACSSDSVVNKINLPSSQKDSCLRDNEIMEYVESECTDFELQHEIISKPLILSPDVAKLDTPQSDSVSLLVAEVQFICNNNFESNPFTDSLNPSIQERFSEVNQSNDVTTSNCLSRELFIEPSSSGSNTVDVSANNGQTFNNLNDPCPNDVILHPCSLTDDNVNVKMLDNDSTDLKSESYNQWKLHLEPESKRKVYVDRVTGNSTYISPKTCGKDIDQDIQEINGSLKKSHFFLTHDYSPFISKTRTPDSSFKNNSGIQNDLKNFVVKNEKRERYQKWRISQENSNHNENSIENMLSVWENPVFDIPYEVTSVANDKNSHNVSQMYSFLNSYRFSNSTLNSLEVIGQVDCKFIACILRHFNENCRDQKLLALFDQHAVHERIRLEELIEDLYETDKEGEKSVKTSTMNPPLQVSFSNEETRLLHTYNEKLRKIGIHLNLDSESQIYSVYSVPSCLVYKETGQLRRTVSDSINILQNAASEWLSSLVKTRSVPQVLPKTLLSVLNYQACRGAVKFGDPLTLEQCSDLLKALSSCKLPFQCAHGRPSIAPILDLKKIEGLYKKRPPPQLRTLTDPLRQ